jgi:uncharacterized protein YukE
MTVRTIRRHLGVPVLVVLLALIALIATHPHAVADWFRLRGYQPSQEIAALADKTTMTDKARHLFYINHPELKDKTAFRKSCPQYDEQTIVIGCYESGQRGIYVLKVDDQRLDGVEEVTAAHEMLHAAYERLSGGERKRVEGLLQDYADNALQNERVIAALKGYRKSEPGQELNEMHSMFGTEIASLPSELETYYAQYFQYRSKVVAAAEAYQAAFTSRQATIKQYDSQLEDLGNTIKSNTETLNKQGDEIDRSRRQLDGFRSSGDVEAYNNGVEPFNAKVVAYNRLLEETRSMISSYNQLVQQRNAIAAQTAELQQAIDSSNLPQSQ